jgi:hypothetical protein
LEENNLTGNDMPMTPDAFRNTFRRDVGEILYVNHGGQIIYNTVTSLYIQSQSEFNMIIAQEKKRIASRPEVLNRIEPWEIGNDLRGDTRRLLMIRAKTNDERKHVINYVKTLGEQ